MSTELAPDEVFCRDCGEVINERAEICPKCGIRQKEPESSTTSEKDSGIAAVLSFFVPGGGQIYNGQIGKGIAILLAVVILVVTVFGIILAVPLWLWQIYDAYKVAEAGGADAIDSSGPISPRRTIEQALDWRKENSDDPDALEELKKRSRKKRLDKLDESDKGRILDVVREYDEQVDRDVVTPVRGRLRLE